MVVFFLLSSIFSLEYRRIIVLFLIGGCFVLIYDDCDLFVNINGLDI